MNDFVSWCMHLLVPFLFHEVTSLHPPSFRYFHLYTLLSYVNTLIPQRATKKKKSAPLEIEKTDLEYGDLLGEGGGGAVYRGTWKSKGITVALKKCGFLLSITMQRFLLNWVNIRTLYLFWVCSRVSRHDSHNCTCEK